MLIAAVAIVNTNTREHKVLVALATLLALWLLGLWNIYNPLHLSPGILVAVTRQQKIALRNQ